MILKIDPTVKADLASTPKPHVDVKTSKIKPVEAVAGAATVVPKSKMPDIDVLTKPKDISTIKSEVVDHVGIAKSKVELDVPEVKDVHDVEAPKHNREQILESLKVKSDTVWDRITPTQPELYGTSIPKSFNILEIQNYGLLQMAQSICMNILGEMA